MSSYPPPPPPPGGQYPPPPPGGQYPPQPPGGQYPPPPYDRFAAKAYRQAAQAQARAMRMQAKVYRQQMRMQRRALRRGSIVGPVVLIALGVVVLLAQMGKISWNHALWWYASWWPVVLIVAGIVLIGEWMLDQQPGPDGTVRAGRRLGGGVVFLLVVLAIAGVSTRVSMRAYDRSSDTINHLFGDHFGGWDHMGDRHDAEDSVNSAIPEGSALVIRSPRGDVQVTGSSDDGQVHVSVHKQAWAWKESDAEEKERQLQPVFSNEGGALTLTVQTVDGGQADLTVEVPHGTPVTLQADHGDVTVNNLGGALLLSANHGDVDVSDIEGPVSAHINDDNASVTGHDITGTVLVDGRTGDVSLSDIHGAVNLQGDFFGNTHLEHVNGQVHFQSTRTLFQVARLDGEMDLDGESLDASQMLGPVVLTTRYGKNITLERTQGSVEITNVGKGSVSVTSAAPLAPITVSNQHGSVDLGLPEGQGFSIHASTGNGDLENDFDLAPQGSSHQQSISGKVGGGGPTISVTTGNGDVTVRKSEVEPLTPPVPPKPVKPAAPGEKVGTAPKAPKAPAAPKIAPPAPPTPPAGVSF